MFFCCVYKILHCLFLIFFLSGSMKNIFLNAQENDYVMLKTFMQKMKLWSWKTHVWSIIYVFFFSIQTWLFQFGVHEHFFDLRKFEEKYEPKILWGDSLHEPIRTSWEIFGQILILGKKLQTWLVFLHVLEAFKNKT